MATCWSTRRADFTDIHLDAVLARIPLGHAQAVPATELALAHIKRPAPNTALLGAFTALTDVVTLDSVIAAIHRTFPGKVGEANERAAREAHALVAAHIAAQKDHADA